MLARAAVSGRYDWGWKIISKMSHSHSWQTSTSGCERPHSVHCHTELAIEILEWPLDMVSNPRQQGRSGNDVHNLVFRRCTPSLLHAINHKGQLWYNEVSATQRHQYKREGGHWGLSWRLATKVYYKPISPKALPFSTVFWETLNKI